MNRLKTLFASYSKMAIFLLLEIVAIFAFTLGNNFVFNLILSSVIFIFIFLVSMKELSGDGYITCGFFIFPILMFGLMNSVSNFTYLDGFPLGSSGVKYVLFIPLVLFASTGYLSSYLKDFNIKKAIFIIYSSLALYVFINFVTNLIQFKPFYTLTYSNYYFFYDGKQIEENVGSCAYSLFGGGFELVSIEYFLFFPGLLITSLVYLFFNSYKDHKATYILYSVYGVLGLLNFLLFPKIGPLLALLCVVIVSTIIVLLNKLRVNKKIVKGIFAITGIILFILFIIFFLNAQGSNHLANNIQGLNDLLTKNSLLNRLFNNRYTTLLDGVLLKDKRMFGGYDLSKSMFFDMFSIGGLFGTCFFIAILVLGIYNMFKYYRVSTDALSDKVMIFVFIFGFLSIGILNYDSMPLIHYNTINSICFSSIFLLVLFLVGYCYGKANHVNKKEDKKNEETIA